jgi:hypothetical protein
LGNIIASLPAVRAVKKINTMSRVYRRLIEVKSSLSFFVKRVTRFDGGGKSATSNFPGCRLQSSDWL